MQEHDQDQGPTSERPCHGYESRRSHHRISGLSDLLPDWVLSQEGKQHVRNARKELLLAMRCLLDTAIERQEDGPTSRRTASRVEID